MGRNIHYNFNIACEPMGKNRGGLKKPYSPAPVIGGLLPLSSNKLYIRAVIHRIHISRNDPMQSNTGSTLYWVRPEPGRGLYELREGDKTRASLEWKNPRRPEAESIAGDKRLSFKRKGFIFPYTAVIDTATGSEFAVFKFHGSDGDLAIGDGRKFRWKFGGIMEPRWYFTTDKGGELLGFSIPPAKRNAIARTVAEVEVLRNVEDNTLTLLAIIGWYNLYNILSIHV